MKVTLTNTETGKNESFEPVDAREILANPETIYKPAKKDASGLVLESSASADINVPQLQGRDDELQTGLSVEKYGREAIINAEPGTAGKPVTTTTGKTVEGTDPTAGADGMTVVEMKAALAAKGVEVPSGALKADLQALLAK